MSLYTSVILSREVGYTKKQCRVALYLGVGARLTRNADVDEQRGTPRLGQDSRDRTAETSAVQEEKLEKRSLMVGSS